MMLLTIVCDLNDMTCFLEKGRGSGLFLEKVKRGGF